MGRKVTGSVFWAVLLVWFPVAVQLSSPRCVTYKHRDACGFKGSSVEFPCSYPNNSQINSISGWYKKLGPDMKPEPLREMPAYSFRMNYLERENDDCTMKLTGLKHTDASSYYFLYHFRNVTGDNVTCEGLPGVTLYIFTSPVKIQVKMLVRGLAVPFGFRTMMEGQRIMLTCVLTCPASLNSNPGYIWYKNRLQLNGNRANSSFLSLDPIGEEDTGSYVCAVIGYKDLPSSAVNLKVQRRPIHTVGSIIPDGGPKKDILPTQTPDAQNSTDQIFINYQTPTSKSILTLSIVIIAGVCIGWVIAIIVAILVLIVKKKKKKKRRRAGSFTGPPDPNSDAYMTLDITSQFADYETLDTMRRCSAVDPVYENLHQPGNSLR